METIINYFETIPSSHRTIILVSGLLLFWILEGVIPISRLMYNKYRHAGVNLFFTLTTLVINLGFAFLIVKGSDWTVANHLGLFQWIGGWPLGLRILIALLGMDLISAYLIHWIEHQVLWMWKFHVIHHSDTKVDTTTALRHHPGESVFRASFTVLAVLLAGAPMWLVMIYQSLSAFSSQFNHANIRIPESVDRVLRLFLVTPAMHRVHHHYKQPLTDRNYGNIFSIWDRIFGTYAFIPAADIVYGLDVFDKRESHLGDLLKVPVDKDSYRQKN